MREITFYYNTGYSQTVQIRASLETCDNIIKQLATDHPTYVGATITKICA